MALTTYPELKTSIANALNVSASDISVMVDDVINISEKAIWHDLRLKEMEQSLSATISSDVVALPLDFIDLKYAYFTDSSNNDYWLEYVQAEFIEKRYLRNHPRAKPDFIATRGKNFIFGPNPDTGPYILHGTYYRRLSQLTSTSVSDTVFQLYPEMYLWKSCSYLERWLGREDRVMVWESMYQDFKKSLNQENKQGTGYALPNY